jgi:prepilin-type N-terminal cleavage/methylation domain-containing protein
MTAGTRAPRPGFTLLEVLLSSAIGVLLMAALYAAMNLQIKHAQAGREVVERSLLVRSLFNRISNDIMLTLAPTTPAASSQGGGSGGSGGSGGMGGSSGGTSGAATGTSGATSGSSGSGTSGAAASGGSSPSGTTASPLGVVTINLGVQGDNTRLILQVSRLPRDVTGLDGQPPACDMRRITYWLAGTGEGLCRQEFRPVTSDDAINVLPPDIPDEASYVLADEVKSLTFQYFDGSAWQDTWDGTQPGADGVTPMGPPQAVAITLEVETPGQARKSYRHVVAIPTANGLTQATTTTTSTTGN